MSPILQFVEKAKDHNADPEEEIQFGTMPPFQGQEIARTTGVNPAGARKILTIYGITHALKRHGNDALEKALTPPQIGLKESDFDLLPTILSQSDSIIKGKDTNRGNKTLKFYKVINRHTYIVIMTLFQGGRKGPKLEFNTMYIKQ